MGKHKQKPEEYPSAGMLVEECRQDYQRIQDSYDAIYNKINIVLAFAGVALTVVLSASDFSSASKVVAGMKVSTLLAVLAELICQMMGVFLIIISIIYYLYLLRSRSVTVFKSEDIRDGEKYEDSEAASAKWLIDAYTSATEATRPVVRKKQNEFNRGLRIIMAGIIIYAVGFMMKKGGF